MDSVQEKLEEWHIEGSIIVKFKQDFNHIDFIILSKLNF